MNKRVLLRLCRPAALALAALLGGCAVYTPYPGPYGYPGYAGGYYPSYVAPPVVGGVYVGGGWGWGRRHRHWR